METPWDDCKVAFGVDDDAGLWRWSEKAAPKASLPTGWAFDGTDGSGARLVAIFRVDGIPAASDGNRVLAFLRRIRAIAPRRTSMAA